MKLSNGKVLYQSKAILNFVGTNGGLHPTDPLDIYKGELMFENFVVESFLGGKRYHDLMVLKDPD